MGRGWDLLLITAVGKIISTRGASTAGCWTEQPTGEWWPLVGETNGHEFILTTIWGSFPHSFHQVVVPNELAQGYPARRLPPRRPPGLTGSTT